MNYLNREHSVRSWLLTTDHKRIALLYLWTIIFFFTIASIAAALMRIELLTPQGDLVTSETYNKLFTIHGVLMVWFFLIPSIPTVLGNFLIPMMLGARDVAFPKLNLISWYIFISAERSRFGRSCTAAWIPAGPFTRPTARLMRIPTSSRWRRAFSSPGFRSIATGLNFIVTIHKMRAPGLTWFRLPLFIWSHVCDQPDHGPGDAGAGDHAGADVGGTVLGGRNFRSEAWRRSGALPAPLLVLLAPCRLHHDSAGHGSNQRVDHLFLTQEDLWLCLGGLCEHGDRDPWLSRLGPSYVCELPIDLCRDGFFDPQLHCRDSIGDQGLQLDCDVA